MKILIASDSFKGSLSSKDICDIATDALTSVLPQAKIHAIALADGGEGTVEALVESTDGVYRNLNVIGPLGEKVSATYGILGDGQTAVIEMSSASGIMLVPQENLNPLLTTSFGTGELILDAIGQGCTRLLWALAAVQLTTVVSACYKHSVIIFRSSRQGNRIRWSIPSSDRFHYL